MRTQKLSKYSTKLLLCATALAVGAAGCAADADETSDVAAAEEGEAEVLAQQAEVPSGNTTYFKSIKANGTGCPRGSIEKSISPDGLAFTVTFNKYETAVNESTTVSTKNCQLMIGLGSPAGYSVAVSEFVYSGYAFLEQGVSLRQTANYYFQGTPVRPESARAELVGRPLYDDPFQFKDTVKTTDLVWSPCGVTRELQVNTTLRMANSNPRRNGLANVSAVDANIRNTVKIPLEDITVNPLRLIVRLAQRRCPQ